MPTESVSSTPPLKQSCSMHNTEQLCENINQLKTSANVWTLSEDNKLCSLLNGVEESLMGRIDETLKRLEESNVAITRSVVNMTNADNRLTSFANDQFIENRVYDDPPPAPRCSSSSSSLEEQKSSKRQEETVENMREASSKRQEETVENMREAVALGFEMIKSHFKRIEMRPEDFDEDDDPTFTPDPIFEPYDSHLSRALPHLLGTPEWNTSPSIGISDSFAVGDHLTERTKGEEIVIGLPQFIQPHHITADAHRINGHRTTTREYDVEEGEEENDDDDDDDGELLQKQQERKATTTVVESVTDSHRSGLFASDNDNGSSSDEALFSDDLFSSPAYKKGRIAESSQSAPLNSGGGISGRAAAAAVGASLISELSRKQQKRIEPDPLASKSTEVVSPPVAPLPNSVQQQNHKSQNQLSKPSSSSSIDHYQPKSHRNSVIFAPGSNDYDAENDEEQPTVFSEKSIKTSKSAIGASKQLKSNTSSADSLPSSAAAAVPASSNVTNLFNKNVTSLFGDSDSDDDIFADVKVKKIDDEPHANSRHNSTANLHPVSTTHNDRHLQNSDSLQKQQSQSSSTANSHPNKLSSTSINSSSYPNMNKSIATASGAIVTTTLTSNLFDDDSDEDDLFKSSTMSSSEKPVFRNRPGGISSNFANRLSQLITTSPKSNAATSSLTTNDVKADDKSAVSIHQKVSDDNDHTNTLLPSLVKSRTKGPSRRAQPTRQARRTKTLSAENKDVIGNVAQTTVGIMEKKIEDDVLNGRLENDNISSDKSSNKAEMVSATTVSVDDSGETDSTKNLTSTKTNEDDDKSSVEEVLTDQELIKEGESTSCSVEQHTAIAHSNEELNPYASETQQRTPSAVVSVAGKARGKRTVAKGGLFASDSNSSDSDDDIFAFSSKLKAHDPKTKLTTVNDSSGLIAVDDTAVAKGSSSAKMPIRTSEGVISSSVKKPAKSKSIFDDSDDDTAEDIASSPLRTPSSYRSQSNIITTSTSVTQQQSAEISSKIQRKSTSPTSTTTTTAKKSSSQKLVHGGGIFDSDSDSDDLFK